MDRLFFGQASSAGGALRGVTPGSGSRTWVLPDWPFTLAVGRGSAELLEVQCPAQLVRLLWLPPLALVLLSGLAGDPGAPPALLPPWLLPRPKEAPPLPGRGAVDGGGLQVRLCPAGQPGRGEARPSLGQCPGRSLFSQHCQGAGILVLAPWGAWKATATAPSLLLVSHKARSPLSFQHTEPQRIPVHLPRAALLHAVLW